MLKFEIAFVFTVSTIWFLYLFRDSLSYEHFYGRCLVYKYTGICYVFSVSVDTLIVVCLILGSPWAVLAWYLVRFPRRPTHFVVWMKGDRIFRYADRASFLLELSEGSDYYLCPLNPTYTPAMRQWLESRDLCVDIVEMLVEEFQELCLSLSEKKLDLTDGE